MSLVIDNYKFELSKESDLRKFLKILLSFVILIIGFFVYNHFVIAELFNLVIVILCLVFSIVIGITEPVNPEDNISSNIPVVTVYGILIGTIVFSGYVFTLGNSVHIKFMSLCFCALISAISSTYTYLIV